MSNLLQGDMALPGVLTEIYTDYNVGYDSSLFGTTDSVIIIGTAFTGPTGVPMPIYSPEHGAYTFGKAYDNVTRRKATLVAGIEDAYQRGCRTIYAVRISGRYTEKSFALSVTDNVWLKMRSTFPTNEAREYYMLYDNTAGDEKIKIFKPAERATIQEKRMGLVEGTNTVMVVTLNLARDYGMTKDTDLFEVIRLVNGYQYNNVISLSLENAQGEQISEGSDVNLSLGALFPGVYFIGRSHSACTKQTEVEYAVTSESSRPYNSFVGPIFKRLKINTDVAQAYPIYAQSMSDLADILEKVEVTTIKPFDFLEIQGLSARAFVHDSEDYEEVNLSTFDIYQKLGSGFAITAKAERRVDGFGNDTTPRIMETPVEDPNRIQAIPDGVYSMLENLGARYRVLVCGNADDEIVSRIPRAESFKTTVPLTVDILEDTIKATPQIGAAEHYDPKKYTFSFVQKSQENLKAETQSIRNSLYTEKVVSFAPFIQNPEEQFSEDPKLPEGALAMFPVPSEELGVVPAKASAELANGAVSVEYNIAGEAGNAYSIVVDNTVGDAVRSLSASLDGTIITVLLAVKDDGFDGFELDDEANIPSLVAAAINEIPNFVATDNGTEALVSEETVNFEGGISALEDKWMLYRLQDGVFVQHSHAGLQDKLYTDGAKLYKGLKITHGNNMFYVFKEEEIASPDGENAPPLYQGKQYLIADIDNRAYIFKVFYDTQGGIQPVGDAASLLAAEENGYLVYATSEHSIVNKVIITSSSFVSTTLEELVDILNQHPAFAGLFEFALTDTGNTRKDDYITDIVANFSTLQEIELPADRSTRWDYSKYVPYKATDNFARHLAQHCTYTSLKTAPTHGVIGITPLMDVGLANVAKRVDEVIEMEFDLYAKNTVGRNILDRFNMPYSIGRNVSITFMQYPVVTRDGYSYITNGAAGYAGMISILPLDQSSTNQSIDIPTPQYTLSNYQLSGLTRKGYVTAKQSYTRGFVITDGVTMALVDSPFRRLAVTRVIGAVEEIIRAAAEPFIGRQNNPANRNALHTAIKSSLDKIKGQLLLSYDFNLVMDRRSMQLTTIDIDYTIVPINEIREINNRIQVTGDLTE